MLKGVSMRVLEDFRMRGLVVWENFPREERLSWIGMTRTAR